MLNEPLLEIRLSHLEDPWTSDKNKIKMLNCTTTQMVVRDGTFPTTLWFFQEINLQINWCGDCILMEYNVTRELRITAERKILTFYLLDTKQIVNTSYQLSRNGGRKCCYSVLIFIIAIHNREWLWHHCILILAPDNYLYIIIFYLIFTN